MRGLNAFFSISSSFLILVLFLSCAFATSHQAPLGPKPAAIPFTFRDATIEDANDITTVNNEAFRRAPVWKYIRQFEDEVDPLYTWSCQRDVFRDMLQRPNIETKVITVLDSNPTSSQQGQGQKEATARERVVSVAMWDFNRTGVHQHYHSEEKSPSYHFLSPFFISPMSSIDNTASSSPSSSSPFNCSAHLDMNLTRALPYSQQLVDAERRYLHEPIPRQLYLELLATHPDWDGNGFAAHQLRWGKARVAKMGGEIDDGGALPITLIGTPAGYPVYVSEGFEGLKNITVERLDGGGIFWHEVMKYEKANVAEGDGL